MMTLRWFTSHSEDLQVFARVSWTAALYCPLEANTSEWLVLRQGLYSRHLLDAPWLAEQSPGRMSWSARRHSNRAPRLLTNHEINKTCECKRSSALRWPMRLRGTQIRRTLIQDPSIRYLVEPNKSKGFEAEGWSDAWEGRSGDVSSEAIMSMYNSPVEILLWVQEVTEGLWISIKCVLGYERCGIWWWISRLYRILAVGAVSGLFVIGYIGTLPSRATHPHVSDVIGVP